MNFREFPLFVVVACITISTLCSIVLVFWYLSFLPAEETIRSTTTENVLFDTLPAVDLNSIATKENVFDELPVPDCPPQYEGYCINGGRCYVQEDVNAAACICKENYGGKRCQKFLWYHWVWSFSCKRNRTPVATQNVFIDNWTFLELHIFRVLFFSFLRKTTVPLKKILCVSYDTTSLLQLIAALVVVKLLISAVLHFGHWERST